jgi:hypothetical protein
MITPISLKITLLIFMQTSMPGKQAEHYIIFISFTEQNINAPCERKMFGWRYIDGKQVMNIGNGKYAIYRVHCKTFYLILKGRVTHLPLERWGQTTRLDDGTKKI